MKGAALILPTVVPNHLQVLRHRPSDSVSTFYYTALNQSESGSGTITIRRAAPEFPVLGEVDLQFGSQPIRGEFRALWEEPPVC